MKRGFDSFFGYWLGAGDYWDQSEAEMYGSWGLDLRNNTEVHVHALKFPLFLNLIPRVIHESLYKFQLHNI